MLLRNNYVVQKSLDIADTLDFTEKTDLGILIEYQSIYILKSTKSVKSNISMLSRDTFNLESTQITTDISDITDITDFTDL